MSLMSLDATRVNGGRRTTPELGAECTVHGICQALSEARAREIHAKIKSGLNPEFERRAGMLRAARAATRAAVLGRSVPLRPLDTECHSLSGLNTAQSRAQADRTFGRKTTNFH